MRDTARFSAGQRAVTGLALAAVLALPPLRDLLESSMRLHMLVQVPLLVAGGWFAAADLPVRARAALDRWNGYGITGLAFVAAGMALLMVPRVLDLAASDPRFDTAKWLVLLASGAAVRLSWRRAGWIVQGFFLGNMLPMLGVAGQLYQDSPLRLCNAYLLQDQVGLGRMLVALAVLAGLAWTACLFASLARREVPALPG